MAAPKLKGDHMYGVGVIRKRHCVVGETGPEGRCFDKTRLALIIPTEEGTQFVVPICPRHIEEAVVEMERLESANEAAA